MRAIAIIYTVILLWIFSLCLLAQDITGSGTIGSPYVLYNGADFDSIRTLGLSNKYYELGADIDLSAYANWTMLPNYTTGIFSLDGRGKSITGFKKTSLDALSGAGAGAGGAGLFQGATGSSTFIVKNLKIVSGNITEVNVGGESYTNIYIGFLACFVQNNSSLIDYVTVTNSDLNFSGTASSLGITDNWGFIFGRVALDATLGDDHIRNCIAELDSLNWTATSAVNPSYRGGGIVGALGGEINFEKNISKYNYFYSRGGSVNRSNTGGGLIGDLAGAGSNKNYIRYNYVHSNKADYGNGGSPNNYPWGWGGIFGYTAVENIHTFEENYAVLNECLGANQSGAFFSEDNSNTTAQVIPTSLNFCDITSFAEPNSVYGSSRLVPAQTADTKTSGELKDIATYVGWDFGAIWDISPTYNLGYPFLRSEERSSADDGAYETFYLFKRREQ